LGHNLTTYNQAVQVTISLTKISTNQWKISTNNDLDWI